MPVSLIEPLVDIITISKDDPEGVLETLRSVHSQNYPRIRHIIVLSRPEDSALPAIKAFTARFEIKIVYQKAGGIENSLNTGILHAEGELLSFLNGGDSYTDFEVVSRAVGSFLREGWQWAIGDTIALSRRRKIQVQHHLQGAMTPRRFRNGQPGCHQSMFYTGALVKRVGLYDEDLKLCADFDFNCRCLQLSPPSLLGFNVSFYDTTGHSSRQILQLTRNLRQVRDRHFRLGLAQRLASDLFLTFDGLRRYLILPLKLYF